MHFTKNGNKRPVFRTVAPEWMTLNAQVGEIANRWSYRNDLLAYIASDAGAVVDRKRNKRAPASYNPNTGEIDLDTVVAFGEFTTPGQIGDFRLRETHREWPKATGALLHEAMHAQHTSDAMCRAHNVLDPGPSHWFDMMDEPRIESRGVRQYPENRQFLRTSALEIVLKDDADKLEKVTQTRAVAHLAVLTLGRVDAGVLKKKDVRAVTGIIERAIPTYVVDQLRELWREFFTLDGKDAGLQRMYELAREFERIVAELEKLRGDTEIPQGEVPQWMLDLLSALGQDRVGTEFDASNEIYEEIQGEIAEAEANAKRAQESDRRASGTISQTVFPKTETTSGREPHPGISTAKLIYEREPTDAERALAAQISDQLRKAQYRDSIPTKRTSQTPPGRLNTAAAIQVSAMRKQRVVSTVEPWSYRQKYRLKDPSLTVGIMGDVSGSQRLASEPMAVALWAMSHAVNRIHGTAAGVLYGRSAFPVLYPGEKLAQIRPYGANDNHEAFDQGFRALDGALDLIGGSGARLLVISSDGDYKGTEPASVIKWLKACRTAGVAVVWLDFLQRTNTAENICAETGAIHVPVGPSVTDAATVIGAACVQALNRASR